MSATCGIRATEPYPAIFRALPEMGAATSNPLTEESLMAVERTGGTPKHLGSHAIDLTPEASLASQQSLHSQCASIDCADVTPSKQLRMSQPDAIQEEEATAGTVEEASVARHTSGVPNTQTQAWWYGSP